MKRLIVLTIILQPLLLVAQLSEHQQAHLPSTFKYGQWNFGIGTGYSLATPRIKPTEHLFDFNSGDLNLRTGYFIGNDFMIGVQYEFSFTTGNFLPHGTGHGFGTFARAYPFDALRRHKIRRTGKKAFSLPIRIFVEYNHLFTTVHRDRSSVEFHDKFTRQIISLPIGFNWKISKSFHGELAFMPMRSAYVTRSPQWNGGARISLEFFLPAMGTKPKKKDKEI